MAFRSIIIDKSEQEFSNSFTELHNEGFVDILKGNGFGIQEARKSTETVFSILNGNPVGLMINFHPFYKDVSLKGVYLILGEICYDNYAFLKIFYDSNSIV